MKFCPISLCLKVQYGYWIELFKLQISYIDNCRTVNGSMSYSITIGMEKCYGAIV